jgi:osmotically-inducible protein OsmY
MRNRRWNGTAILGALAVLLTGALAGAADDGAIQEAIESRLQKDKLSRQANVEVVVRDGEATLTGMATSLPAKRKIEKLARKEAQTVHNKIQVRFEEPVKDAEIVQGVRSAILTDPRYDVFDYVEFAVEDGAVLLLGSVSQPWKKSSIENRVARVPGVRAIQNDVTVQSLSPFDSQLRATLLQRIYGDVRFVQYASRSHPPIRILVDRGNVTLAGSVGSPVEKAILGNIARDTLSFRVENHLRVDGEVPEEDRPGESVET